MAEKPKKPAVEPKEKPDRSSHASALQAKAYVLSYRRSLERVHQNQFLLAIDDVDSKEKAAQYIGKKVVWKTQGNREIRGKITSPHGNSGVVRARFEHALPGQILGKNVIILGK